ncbi:hypothetical protein CERSUDRAFT_156791 [Gelatoporia subvermispora B]|uniref:Alpha/beta hydrolase fold-3 domain-containing protein n=1 Tax=Ceriporiopsis subvermispora (strain B) TaxID=914234 RepID=M2RB73_CERS8|nr:hypothetical protein CERSUDRAFT_156791 [Gelatoporia subvermispora B]
MPEDELALLNPEYAALLETLPPPEPLPENLADVRKEQDDAWLRIVKSINEPLLPPESSYRVQDFRVPVEQGDITVRCLTPTPPGTTPQENYPLLYWIHGGGWASGSVEIDDLFLRIICVELRMSIANVGYRLCPEHKFPVPVNDAYAGLKWAAQNAHQLSASLHKGFIVAGFSAGGNLAAVLAHRARDDPFFEGRRLTGQLLQVPEVVHPDAYPTQYRDQLRSYRTVGDPRVFYGEEMDLHYAQYGAQPFNPECSPLLLPSHMGLAPAYIQVCGADPVRDEGILYAQVLQDAGVTTKLEIYPGDGHGFHFDLPHSKAGLRFVQDFKDGLKWLLALPSGSAG